MPIIIGRTFGSISGLLSGFVGFLSVFSIMFPFPALGILSSRPEVPTSLISTVLFSTLFEGNILLKILMQYTLIPLCLSILGFAAGFLSRRRFGDYLFPFAAVLWLGIAVLYNPTGFYDVDLFAQIALSMTWAIVVTTLIEKRLGEKLLTSSHILKKDMEPAPENE